MTSWITHFGANPDSWNIDTGGDDGRSGDGMPGVALFGDAVRAWALLQKRDVTVTEAAQAFAVPPELIREAAEYDAGMTVVGEPIGLKGTLSEHHLGNAVQVWALTPAPRSAVTVADAALAFNLRPERIREAIEEH